MVTVKYKLSMAINWLNLTIACSFQIYWITSFFHVLLTASRVHYTVDHKMS